MLSIPNPCNEDFDKMTPTDRGVFCDKCAIDTYDFRKQSNEQILETLTKSREHLCGRFYEDQLDDFNRYQAYKSDPVKRKWTSLYAASILAGVFAVSCTQGSDVAEELSAERKHIALFRESEEMIEMANHHLTFEELEIIPPPPPVEDWELVHEEEPILEYPVYDCSYNYEVEYAGTDSAGVILDEVRIVERYRTQLSGDLISSRTLGGVPIQSRHESIERPGFFKRLFSRKNKQKKD